MNVADLMNEAILKYGFRSPLQSESPAEYRDALIKHVNQRDWAAAHELRVGKPQAHWTASEVGLFQRLIIASGGAKQEFSPGLHGMAIAEDPGPYPVSELALIDIAICGLGEAMERRKKSPREDLPPYASVLLTDGRLLSTIPDSEDRIATIKFLARRYDVFGFYMVMDMFVHSIDPTKASKSDAICVQVGTRSLRLLKIRPYHFANSRRVVIFDPPPPDAKPNEGAFDDPYACVFETEQRRKA